MEKDIRKRILDLMKLNNISYGELQKRTGLSKSTLQRYIANDKSRIPIDRASTIAKGLNTTTAYLMGWTDYPYQADNNYLIAFPTKNNETNDNTKYMTTEEIALKYLLKECGYDLLKDEDKYFFIGKKCGSMPIAKRTVDDLISKTKELVELLAEKISTDLLFEVFETMNTPKSINLDNKNIENKKNFLRKKKNKGD